MVWCNRSSSGWSALAEEACVYTYIYTILSFIEKLGIYHESRPLTPELEISDRTYTRYCHTYVDSLTSFVLIISKAWITSLFLGRCETQCKWQERRSSPARDPAEAEMKKATSKQENMTRPFTITDTWANAYHPYTSWSNNVNYDTNTHFVRTFIHSFVPSFVPTFVLTVTKIRLKYVNVNIEPYLNTRLYE